MEQCSLSFYDYEENDYQLQDILISCCTEDCKKLTDNYELLFEIILENYEFVKTVKILSTEHEDWFITFEVNILENGQEIVEEIENTKEIKENIFKKRKKIERKSKINLIWIAIAEHFYSIITTILDILYD